MKNYIDIDYIFNKRRSIEDIIAAFEYIKNENIDKKCFVEDVGSYESILRVFFEKIKQEYIK